MLVTMGLALWLAGCSGGGDGGSDDCNCDYDPITEGSGLAIKFERQDEREPANVSVMFKVDTYSGTPLTALTMANFQIFEDARRFPHLKVSLPLFPSPGLSNPIPCCSLISAAVCWKAKISRC